MEPDDFNQDDSGSYAEEAGINDDYSITDNDPPPSDGGEGYNQARYGTVAPSPKDTGIFGGGGAGDFGLGPKSKEEDNFLNQQMVDYYTKSRGATATNPFPESFFSKLVGIEHVNYAESMGKARVQELNELRARQAFNLPSLNTGKQYTENDYYIGQDTNMGEVKPIPSTARDFMNFMPGGGILNSLTGQPGLPEFDPRYQEIMNEKAKSANDPTVFDGVTDYLKDMFGMVPKDSGASLAAGSLKEGQFGIPDNRKFDAFGNESATEIDFPNSFSSRPEPEGYNTVINPVTGRMVLRDNKIEPSQIFKNIGDQANQTVATTPNFSVSGFMGDKNASNASDYLDNYRTALQDDANRRNRERLNR